MSRDDAATGPGPTATRTLTFAATPGGVDPLRREVLQFLEPFALPARAVYRIELVLEEVVMNLAWHAFPEGGEHAAALTVVVAPDAVTLRFADDGVPFDPTATAAPARPASIDEARPGGLGLALLRGASRDVHYARIDGRNVLTVVVERR